MYSVQWHGATPVTQTVGLPMWNKDYFAVCHLCYRDEWMDGRTLAKAKETARRKGWKVNPVVCPECVATQHRLHQTAGGRGSKKSKLVVPAAGKA